MPAVSPMRATSCCASLALATSKATMRRSRIPRDADEGVLTGECMAILPSIFVFRLLCAISLIYSHIFRLNQVDPDPLHAIAEIEHPRSTVAQIHDSVSYVRSPIIDPNNDPFAVLQVGYLDERSQRELPVSGCELEHVEIFTACCGLAVKLLAVPGCCTYLIGFLFSLCTLL